MNFIIIGAGPAGLRAAETLRETVPTASITLISGEPGQPYARMAIPYILNGAIDEDGARQRRSHQHLEGLAITYLNGRVRQVFAGPDGGQVELEDGSRLHYDELLVATGSSPTPPPLKGVDLPGVLSCWTLDDARQISAKLQPGARVVMLGAGFVAGVCMKSLVASGAKLSVVAGRSGQILRSMMTPVGSQMLQRWLEARGVEVITSGRTLRIEPGPRLVLDSRSIDADLIILATGVRPNLGFLEGTGVEIRNGVVIDQHMRSNVPHIYAAGDVAQGRDFSTGDWVVHALQPTATEHGRIAALNMAGRHLAYRGSLSMNVLDTVGLISHTFGLWQGLDEGDNTEVVDETNFIYTRLCFDRDRLVGAITVGHSQHVGAIRGLIQSHRHLGAWKPRLMANPHLVMDAFVELNQG
jgi:NAD(P)H-nitrite reductase large subunit